MFQDFSNRALSCSEEIATFNSLYVKSQSIFEHAASSRARDPEDIRRLAVGEVFLPEEQPQESDGVKKEDTEMKDAPAVGEEKEEEEEVVENTKDEDIEDVVEEFSGRLMHRDVNVEELPGGTPARRSLKVCGMNLWQWGGLFCSRFHRLFFHHRPPSSLPSRSPRPLITRAPSS